jgi:hypothetical protein
MGPTNKKIFLQNFKITALWMLCKTLENNFQSAWLYIGWVVRFDFMSNSDRPRPRKTGRWWQLGVVNKFCKPYEKWTPFSGKREKKGKFLTSNYILLLTWKFPCSRLKIGRFWQMPVLHSIFFLSPSVPKYVLLLMTINLASPSYKIYLKHLSKNTLREKKRSLYTHMEPPTTTTQSSLRASTGRT